VTLKAKLVTLALAPLAIALGLSYMDIFAQSHDNSEIQDALLNLQYLKKASLFIGAVEKERDTATLLLSGGLDVAKFDASVQATNDSEDPWVEAYKKARLPEKILDDVDKALTAIRSIRSAVRGMAADPNDAFSAYSSTVDSLLDGSRLAASHASPGTANRYLGFVMLEEAKEWANRTRDMASGIVTANKRIDENEALDLLARFGSIRSLLSSRALELSNDSQADRDLAYKSDEYKDFASSVLGVIRKSNVGGYSLNGVDLFNKANAIIGKIQAIIDREENSVQADVAASATKLRTTFLITISIVILAFLAQIVTALIIMTSVTRRLHVITAAFHDVAAGEGDLARTIAVSSNDEIGVMAGDFNVFTGVIRDLVNRVKEETRKINGNMDELAANMNDTTSAVQEIAATIDSIKQQGINQSASVSESSATVEEIAKRVGILTAAIERLAENVSLSGSSTEEMVANVQSVTANVESMGAYYQRLQSHSNEGRETIRRLSAQAKDIVQQSNSLQEANALISGIASQTNLLAMNAAIEAAHAGEAGRGFSVVADEIRKLAENAAIQSKAVTRNINSIRHAIEAVVSSSVDTEKAFEEIVEQIAVLSNLEEEVKNAMREQSEGSSQIVEALSGMNSVTSEVKTEATAMREGSATVLEEMNRLLRLTSELENGMAEMASGAAQIRAAASATNSLSIRAVESVKALAGETEKFKT